MIAPLFGSITRPLLSPLVSGLRDELFGAFTPRSLFNDGSIGVLYDNNDLTTMFVDAAGTTPATVNGLVGLQLDKSQGLVFGAEAFPTLDLTTWTSAADVSAKTATSFTTTGFGGVYTSISGWANTKTYNIRLVGSTTVAFNVRNTDNVSGLVSIPVGAFDVTIKSPLLTQNSTSGMLYFQVDSAGTVSFTSLSVKELPGNHRYQTTTGSKPILRGTPTGANTVRNPNFDTDTLWSKGTGWTIGSGVATATAATGFLVATMATAVVASRVYRVTYTLTRTAGSIAANIGGINGTSRSASGTYVDYITAFNTGAFAFVPTTFSGTVDNVEVVDVSAGSVTAPYGLQYDGVDDFLQTASVNFTATDKMFVCAGVRKLSDAATGCLLELSANKNANPGIFAMFAPITGGEGSYTWHSKGTIEWSAVALISAPDTSIITGIGDISGDLCRIRRNGSDVQTTALDQGTGNYGNYAIYFGRRGGTSLPYHGIDFGFVIVGKTLTAAQISSTERWMAQRTGVSI